MSFDEIVHSVCERMSGTIKVANPGSDYQIEAQLEDGRHQRVFIVSDGETIRFSTQCSGWTTDFQQPNLFKTLLRKNFHLKHGYFALNDEGGVVLVDSQLLETCDPEELYVTLVNLAEVGDFMERQLSGSIDEDDKTPDIY